jgi:O-antigen ligase
VGDALVALTVLALVGGQVSMRLWRALALAGVIAALAGVWGAVGLMAAPRSDWSAPFLAQAGAGLFSVAPDRTWLELSKLAGASALVLAAAAAAASPRQAEAVLKALLAVGALHTAAGLIMYAADPDSVAGYAKGGHQWRFTGTLLNANACAASLAMSAALAAAYFRTTLRVLGKAPSGAKSDPMIRCGVAAMLIFLFAGACAMTQSRTALAALLLVVAAIVFFPSRAGGEDAEEGGRRRRWGRVAAGAVAALACIGVAVALTGGSTLERLSEIEGDASTRLQAYELFIGKTLEAPLFGYGLGSFAMVANPGADVDLASRIWNMGAAHNAWLQAAMEGGLPYAVALTAAVAAFLGMALLRRAVTPGQRAARLAAFGGLVAVTVSALVDIALNVPAVAAQAMVLVGVFGGASLGDTSAVRHGSHRRRRARRRRSSDAGEDEVAA